MNIQLNTKHYLIFVAAFSAFLTAFLSNATSIIIPYIAKDLAMNNVLQNWIATIFLLTIAVLSLPIGNLSTHFGLKKFFVLGLLVFLIGTITCAISFDSFTLLASRAIQGVGGALLSVTGMALVVSKLPPNERGKGIGLNVAGVYIGLSIAPVIAGFLASNYGWQSVFYVVIPFSLLILIIAIFKIEEVETQKLASFDYIGSIIYSIGILIFIYGFTILNKPLGMTLAGIGLVLLIIFAYMQLNTEYPIFDFRLFKNVKFTSANLASLISYIATFVTTLVVSYHLQYIRGFNPQSAGFFIIILPVMMALVAPFAGRLSDKINPQILSAVGMGLATLALFILAFLNADTPLYFVSIALFLQGLGYGLFSSPNTNTIMSSVPPKDIPAASSAIATVRVIGQSMSMGMITLIFAVIMGNVKIVHQYYPLLIYSSQIAFAIATVLGFIAVILSLIGLKSKDSIK